MDNDTVARDTTAGLWLWGLVAALLVSRAFFLWMLPIYDDAFITWRYSLNLVEQGSFVYNLGHRVLGTTAPLFGLLVAALVPVLGPPEGWVPVLNILIDGAIVVAVHHVLFRSDLRLTSGFVLLFAASPVAGRIAVGGMEANLFALVVILSIGLATQARGVPAAILAALSVFLRPEGVLVAIAGFIALAMSNKKALVPYVITGLVIGAICGGLMFAFYGSILPQSVVAKGEAIGSSKMEVVRALILPDEMSRLALPFALLGLLIGRGRGPALWIFNGWAAVYLLLYFLASPHIWSWYALPVQIFLYINAAQALVRISDMIPGVRHVSDRFGAGLVAAVVVAFLASVAFSIGRDRITAQVYSGIETFCASIAREGTTILADDIGVIGYYCRPAKIIDIAGLVWPEAKEYPDDIAIAVATRPDYIMFASFEWKLKSLLSSPIADDYRYLFRLNASGRSDGQLDMTGIDNAWKQEYFFFKRIGPAQR